MIYSIGAPMLYIDKHVKNLSWRLLVPLRFCGVYGSKRWDEDRWLVSYIMFGVNILLSRRLLVPLRSCDVYGFKRYNGVRWLV